VLAAVGVGIVALLLFLIPVAFWSHGQPNAAAERREEELLGIRVGDPASIGLTLIEERSSPGSPASGFMADNPDDVAVLRRYSYSGEPHATCESVTAQLVAEGWVGTDYNFPCELSTAGDAVRASLSRECRDFTVHVRVSAFGPTAVPNDGIVSIGLRTAYPDLQRPTGYEDLPSRNDESTSTSKAVTC
jgi:hypothetical protein